MKGEGVFKPGSELEDHVNVLHQIAAGRGEFFESGQQLLQKRKPLTLTPALSHGERGK